MPFNNRQDAYLSLRNIVAERTSPIVAWVGSGLSASLGVPMWAALRRRLAEAMERKIDTYSAAERSHQKAKLARAVSEPNPWLAFQMLQTQLGSTTYRDTIREAIRPAETAQAPDSYRYLWKMRIRGLINLNIDRLATKALVETSAAVPLEYTGRHRAPLGQLLKENRPFILNLHGQADDASTWVFTKEELDALRRVPGYSDFIRSCLFSNTILFMGITVDDAAVGGHLEALRTQGIHSGTHFWVTSRTDRSTDEWAEDLGVRVIRYDASNGDHSAVDDMFTDLLAYVPPEDAPVHVPVVSQSNVAPIDTLPPPAELAKEDANDIREKLNSYVRSLLSRGNDAELHYAEFQRTYDEAIYRAWYLNTDRRGEKLLQYKLDAPAAKGAFGRVYRATNSAGESVAIKVLLEEIRNNKELLQSFRRGVRSMRILSDRGVPGVVTYRDSSEIPAFVVMDWVDGPSLEEAVEARHFQDWSTILRTAKHLTRVIREAHELPERVLHRDLRPSNVMLMNFYSEPDEWKVVVLDFDLSWHLGADEKSVIHGSTLYGYLAPEQIARLAGVSTRHSAVDSFGLGMIMFFMVSGRHPLPAQHRHSNWPEAVHEACDRHTSTAWTSLPERFARLIINATRDEQSNRWDVAQIQTELDQLWIAGSRPESVISPEVLAEEIASRTATLRKYEWHPDYARASHRLPTGLQVTLAGDPVKRRLALRVDWENTGVQQHRKVGKFVGPAAQNCHAILRSGGWNAVHSVGVQTLTVEATISADVASRQLDQCASTIDRAMDPLRLE
ncbi:MAG: protein kinase [Nitrosomonadales bacterium]|nr:protein kinase [Nitrosomonadales bacterium]